MSEGWIIASVYLGLFVVLPATLYLIQFLREASFASAAHRRLYRSVMLRTSAPSGVFFLLRIGLLYVVLNIASVDDPAAGTVYLLWTFIPEVVWLAYRLFHVHEEFVLQRQGVWADLRVGYIRTYPGWVFRTELIIGTLVTATIIISVIIHGSDLNYERTSNSNRVWTNGIALATGVASAWLLTHFFPPREPIDGEVLQQDPKLPRSRPGTLPTKEQMANRFRDWRKP